MIIILYKTMEKTLRLQDLTRELLEKIGMTGEFLNLVSVIINILVLFVICWIAFSIFRKILKIIIGSWLKKINPEHSHIFYDNRVFSTLSHFASGIVFYNLLPYFFNINEEGIHIFRVIAVIYIILMITAALKRILASLEYLARNNERYEKKPINSYIQVVLILVYLVSAILIISILIGKSPLTIITAFGAGMAIVMLIFKDLILGLVASVQVSVNDMVRVGDWVSIKAYDADGTVIEINLTSVKVRNWDRTVSNIPTYALVSQGFRNVREMEDLGLRRFLHHLLIDVRSIKEVDSDFVETLRSKGLFKGNKDELSWETTDEYAFKQVKSITNLGLFRNYVEAFLWEHPGVDENYIVVRQLQQKGEGVPIEVYAWAKTVSFKPINLIQSDVFEHLYVTAAAFDLVLYQKPSGYDLEKLVEN